MNRCTDLRIREIASISTSICRPIQCDIERIVIGDFHIWVRAEREAQQWDVRIVTPILTGDEYELQPIKRDGHDVRTVVDIGGHVGAFALKVKRLWPQAMIIALEPDPIGASLYCANTKDLPDVYVVEGAAVGKERERDALLHRNGREPENAASNYIRDIARDLTPKALSPESQGDIAVVSGLRIAELLEKQRVEQVDILKIDCEGAEGEVLEDLREQGWLPRIRWLRGEWHFEESIPRIRAAVERTHVLSLYTPPASARAWNGFFLAHRRGDTLPGVSGPSAPAMVDSSRR